MIMARRIEVAADLWVRFPGCDTSFDDGVEIGIAAANMAAGLPVISLSVDEQALPILRTLARRMSYRLSLVSSDAQATVVLERTDLRPGLRIVA
jgi:hypothetical protein